MTPLQTDIERRIAQSEPDVEVLLAEVVSSPTHPTLRVFIDHPEGVTLALCERFCAEFLKATDSIATDISIQMGKPIGQAQGEVKTAVARAKYMMSIAAQTLAPEQLPPIDGFSRRITQEHRLVYRVTESRVDFLQARYHYE